MIILSAWLVPQGDDLKSLSEIIKKLAKENNSPVFTPHLTLFGDIEVELNTLKKAVDDVFKDIKPFKVKTTGISQSELFFKTVFVEFELDENLRNLFKALSSKTDNRGIESFKPHISLMYKTMPEKDKLKIIESLRVNAEYTLGSVYINAPKDETNNFLDIEGWRILYKKSFT